MAQYADAARQVAHLLKTSRKIVILTGAGVSKESGVPTFRDAMEGLWARFDPQELATPQAFRANPKLVWEWYEWRRERVRSAAPNPGHLALAALERRFPTLTLITQNVDDLHERAGSRRILHLHGNIAQSKCFFDCQGSPTLIDVARLTWAKESGPPPCPHCGRWVRPDVVWFGEALPEDVLQEALIDSAHCDLMLVVGTSALVSPASAMPQIAYQNGAAVIECNPDSTPISSLARVRLPGPSGEMLPLVIEALDDATA